MNIYELKSYQLQSEGMKFNKTAYGSKACSYVILSFLLMVFFFCIGGALLYCGLVYHYGKEIVESGLICLVISSIFLGVNFINQLQYGKLLKEYVESKAEEDKKE